MKLKLLITALLLGLLPGVARAGENRTNPPPQSARSLVAGDQQRAAHRARVENWRAQRNGKTNELQPVIKPATLPREDVQAKLKRLREERKQAMTNYALTNPVPAKP